MEPDRALQGAVRFRIVDYMRPKQTAKRTKKLSAPANEDELNEYYTACEIANVEPADTLRKLARAFSAHVAKQKSIRFPITIEK